MLFSTQAEGENEVNNELANRMSLFYAEATPMLKTLSDATTKFVSEVSTTQDHFSALLLFCLPADSMSAASPTAFSASAKRMGSQMYTLVPPLPEAHLSAASLRVGSIVTKPES